MSLTLRPRGRKLVAGRRGAFAVVVVASLLLAGRAAQATP
jgi:hypothetical protein